MKKNGSIGDLKMTLRTKDGFKTAFFPFKDTLRVILPVNKKLEKSIKDGIDVWYHCSKCDYLADRRKKYDDHVKEKTCQSVNHKCTECDFTTNSSYSLNKHAALQHVLYMCHTCSYTTSIPARLQNHITRKHGGKKQDAYRCNFCSYVTTKSRSLSNHMRTHKPKVVCSVGTQIDESDLNIVESPLGPVLWDAPLGELADYLPPNEGESKLNIGDDSLGPVLWHVPYSDSTDNALPIEDETVLNMGEILDEPMPLHVSLGVSTDNLPPNEVSNFKPWYYEHGKHEILCPSLVKKSETSDAVPSGPIKMPTISHVCEKCNFSTPCHMAFRRHMSNHGLPTLLYECDQCDYQTMLKHELKFHKKDYHNQPKLPVYSIESFLDPPPQYHLPKEADGVKVGETKRKATMVWYHCLKCSFIVRTKEELEEHERTTCVGHRLLVPDNRDSSQDESQKYTSSVPWTISKNDENLENKIQEILSDENSRTGAVDIPNKQTLNNGTICDRQATKSIASVPLSSWYQCQNCGHLAHNKDLFSIHVKSCQKKVVRKRAEKKEDCDLVNEMKKPKRVIKNAGIAGKAGWPVIVNAMTIAEPDIPAVPFFQAVYVESNPVIYNSTIENGAINCL
ncbi:hypothetical protein AAG570_003667 [Ranatra chinensis]|uniref:C2H2-type domain-containing protein n=1 Tax=Ranatra chinensis TaxID=642074 RepID=A0ABD0YGR9_9HEMI